MLRATKTIDKKAPGVIERTTKNNFTNSSKLKKNSVKKIVIRGTRKTCETIIAMNFLPKDKMTQTAIVFSKQLISWLDFYAANFSWLRLQAANFQPASWCTS